MGVLSFDSGAQTQPCPVLVFWVGLFFILVELCLSLRFALRIHTFGREIDPLQIRANVLCHVLIVLYTACDIFHAFCTLTTNSEWIVTSGFAAVFHILADVFYFGCFMAIYGVLLHRLWISFKDSAYRLKRKSLKIMGALAIVQTILFISYMFLLSRCENRRFNNHMSSKKRNRYFRLMGVNSLAITLVGFALNGYLVHLFVSKLRSVIVRSVAMSDSRSLEQSNRSTHKLLFTASKHTVIGLLLVAFGQLFFTTETFVFGLGNAKYFGSYIATLYIVRAFEGVYDMILLDLAFAYSNVLYLKLCGACHKVISNSTRRRIVKKTYVSPRLLPHPTSLTFTNPKSIDSTESSTTFLH